MSSATAWLVVLTILLLGTIICVIILLVRQHEGRRGRDGPRGSDGATGAVGPSGNGSLDGTWSVYTAATGTTGYTLTSSSPRDILFRGEPDPAVTTEVFLPRISTVANGASYRFANEQTVSSGHLNSNSNDDPISPDTTLAPGDWVILKSDGTSMWFVK